MRSKWRDVSFATKAMDVWQALRRDTSPLPRCKANCASKCSMATAAWRKRAPRTDLRKYSPPLRGRKFFFMETGNLINIVFRHFHWHVDFWVKLTPMSSLAKILGRMTVLLFYPSFILPLPNWPSPCRHEWVPESLRHFWQPLWGTRRSRLGTTHISSPLMAI